MASPNTAMETDEIVVDERAQVQQRLLWEPPTDYVHVIPELEEGEISQPEIEGAADEEEEVTTPRIAIAPEEEEVRSLRTEIAPVEEEVRTPLIESAPEVEEEVTTPRIERTLSDLSARSGGTDIVAMEVEPIQVLSAEEGSADRGLAVTEEELRKAVRSNSHAVLARAAEIPISEIDIPLCRMVAMTEVRKPLEVDIQKLRAEFTRGYRRGGPVFYVAVKSFEMEECFVTEEMRRGWSKLWQKADRDFERVLNSNPELARFSNRMFHVWDGNHRLLAWYPLIEWNHKYDPAFHVPVKSIMLSITDANRKEILHAMTDWNK